jgi:hypothetical protein
MAEYFLIVCLLKMKEQIYSKKKKLKEEHLNLLRQRNRNWSSSSFRHLLKNYSLFGI